jgi:predicted ATPase
MDDEQRNHLEELLRTQHRNLRHLEQQAAQHGIDVPVIVKNSIDHARAEIARLEAALAQTEGPPSIALPDSDEPHLGEPRAARPPTLLGSRRDNLPAPTTALIGREREVAAVCTLLRRPDVRIVTLTGPGGTGKTRLALHIASELLDPTASPSLPSRPEQRGEGLFLDGVWFVALAPIHDPNLVIPTIAQALGVRETSGLALLTALKSELRERRLLLALDNFEQIVEAAPLVSELLEAAPGLKALITSREVLKLYGEREFSVPPLGLPDLDHLPPCEQLAKYEAIRLFVERAQSVRADFAITSANARAIAEMCARLDGLPLALELAAARSKLFTPEKLLAQLTSRLKLLTGGARNLPERQRTLRGAIDWSYNLLDEGERALFRRLAVFAGGCTLEAAEAVANADSDLAFDVLDGLAALIDKSLLRQIDDEWGEARFVMLETIREYALEKLAQSDETATALDRHLRFFLTFLENLIPKLQDQPPAARWSRIETENDNFRTALTWSQAEAADHETGLRLAVALSPFWNARGYYIEGRQWLETALEQNPDAQIVLRARGLRTVGTLVQFQGDYAAARRRFEDSLALHQALGEKGGTAVLLRDLGWIDFFQGYRAAAQAHFEESLALCRDIGHQSGIAQALRGLSRVAAAQGDLLKARALLEESLVICRERSDTLGIAGSRSELASIARSQGDLATARALLEENLATWREYGDKPGIAGTLGNLATVSSLQRDWEQAAQLFEESLALYHQMGDKRSIAWVLSNMGNMALEQHNDTKAQGYFEACRDLFRAVGEIGSTANQLQRLGRLAIKRGDYGQATAYFEEGLTLYRELDDRSGIARALRHLGLAAQDQGDNERATALCEESLALFRSLGDQRGIAWATESLGFVARKQGDHIRAAMYYDECLASYCELLGQAGAAYLFYNYGLVALQQDDLIRAEEYLAESIRLYQEQEGGGKIVLPLVGMAGVVAARKLLERAACLFGAADALRQLFGKHLDADDRAELDAAIAAARAQLDGVAFVVAWEKGQTMTLEQAIAYALEQHPAANA